MPYEPFVATASLTTAIGSGSVTLGARQRRRTDFSCAIATRAARIAAARRRGRAVRRRAWLRARISITAGSDLGYWLGVAGRRGDARAVRLSVAQALARACAKLGSTRFWFALHMTLGIAGPLLIVAALDAALRVAERDRRVRVDGAGRRERRSSGASSTRASTTVSTAAARRWRSCARRRHRFGGACARSSRSRPRRSAASRNSRSARRRPAQAGLGHPLRFMALGLRARLRAAPVHARPSACAAAHRAQRRVASRRPRAPRSPAGAR